MTIWQHLEELRYRLGVCFIAILFGTAVSFYWFQPIVRILLHPAGDIKLIYTYPSEAVVQSIKIAFFSGFVLAFPVVIYQFWAFISPALYPKEKRWAYWLIPPSFALFLTGLLFGYFALLPILLRFLFSVGQGMFEPMIRISSYVSFAVWILLLCGIIFEIPLITFVLTVAGILTPAFLAQRWKYIVVGVFILAAVITPPDVISQTIVAIPILGLFASSYIISLVVFRWKRREYQSEPSGSISLSE